MGFDKLLVPILGRAVLLHSLDRFEACPAVSEIILVLHPERREEIVRIVGAEPYTKVRRVVEGGSARHLSVWAGLQASMPEADLVAVHDAARPFVRSEAIVLAIRQAGLCGGVALAAPGVETLKRTGRDNVVNASVDREGLWAMQTPQVFRRDWLWAGYETILARGEIVTDEVSAVQAVGHPVKLLENSTWNLKITFPRDLEMAEGLMRLVPGAIGKGS